jgi:hypothetical protein
MSGHRRRLMMRPCSPSSRRRCAADFGLDDDCARAVSPLSPVPIQLDARRLRPLRGPANTVGAFTESAARSRRSAQSSLGLDRVKPARDFTNVRLTHFAMASSSHSDHLPISSRRRRAFDDERDIGCGYLREPVDARCDANLILVTMK